MFLQPLSTALRKTRPISPSLSSVVPRGLCLKLDRYTASRYFRSFAYLL